MYLNLTCFGKISEIHLSQNQDEEMSAISSSSAAAVAEAATSTALDTLVQTACQSFSTASQSNSLQNSSASTLEPLVEQECDNMGSNLEVMDESVAVCTSALLEAVSTMVNSNTVSFSSTTFSDQALGSTIGNMLDPNIQGVLAAVNQAVRGPSVNAVGLPTMAYKQIENSSDDVDGNDRRDSELNEVCFCTRIYAID